MTGLLAKMRLAVAAAGGSDSKDAACVTKLAEQNVRNSPAEIRAQSPLLEGYLASGTVQWVGAMYEVATGRVTLLDAAPP